jgi:hypothetical protein
MRIINDYQPEVESLLQSLIDAGCKIISGSNGGEPFPSTLPKAEFLEELLGADEALLRVETPDGKRKTLYLVYGNEPGVIVNDYHVHPVLDAVCDAHYAKWDGKEQPTRTV